MGSSVMSLVAIPKRRAAGLHGGDEGIAAFPRRAAGFRNAFEIPILPGTGEADVNVFVRLIIILAYRTSPHPAILERGIP